MYAETDIGADGGAPTKTELEVLGADVPSGPWVRTVNAYITPFVNPVAMTDNPESNGKFKVLLYPAGELAII